MADGGVPARQRQLALLALCVLGLLVAAAAAPQVDAGLGLGPGGTGGGPANIPDGGGSGSGGGTGIGDAIEELLRWLSGGEKRERDPAGCVVKFASDPVPGRTIPVVVAASGLGIEDARVSLNGEFVGRTDEYGRVPVAVPYERDLTLSATLPAGAECSRNRQAASESLASGAVGSVGAPAADASVRRGAVANHEQADGPRVTRAVTVDSEVKITVDGEPIPGGRVSIRATISEAPMREATVTLDGEQVGTTDDEGRYRLRIPADGRDTLTVRVERGEFTGRKTVDVTDLRVVVKPETVLAVPGADAVVIARLGNRTVPNATVTLDGARLGTTDARGRLRVSLPADPTAVVGLRASGLRATQSLLPLYALTAVVVVLVLAVLALAVAKLTGRTGAIRDRGASLLTRLRRVPRLLVALAFRVTAAVERLLDWLAVRVRALRVALGSLTGLRTLPGAVRAALAGAFAWLLALPGRVLDLLRAALAWVRGLPGRLGRGDDGDDETTTAADTERSTGDDPEPSGLRERWRAFARWVAPERWPRRTPGEVAREAAATGFPRESVRELTRVFRDVEYGDRPETPEREERARTAFDTLRDHREAAESGADRRADDEEVTDRG